MSKEELNKYWNEYELPHVPVYDKNGIELHDGDIVAECEVGELIWDGKCEVIEQPLGKVRVFNDGTVNIHQYKPGRIKAIKDISYDPIKKYIEEDGRLYISTYDGIFLSWDDIEIIKE